MNKGYALILAAGYSTRMGCCKALLPWGEGQTLLSFQIRQWQQLQVEPIVVVGSHNVAEIQPLLHCQLLVNPAASTGKVSSLLMGLQALPSSWNFLVISAVDQPRPSWVYAHLLKAHANRAESITVPVYADQTGHPVIFGAQFQSDLHSITEVQFGIRQVLNNHPSRIQRVKINSPWVHADLNTLADYNAAKIQRASL
ncbi:MAG: nucleotidyltransferase family protein [Synechococcaceae cyanobacterium SM2_3_1]|nr:nucleotidyltransferase family protein [Synechococcaceae cyanobacterium SM2_3_1]